MAMNDDDANMKDEYQNQNSFDRHKQINTLRSDIAYKLLAAK